MGVGFGELGFSIGMAGITDLVHSVFHHTGKIRAMGVVARAAADLYEGRMWMLYLLGIFHLPMTGEADLPLFLEEQGIVLGRMGCMTRQTSLLAVNGNVFDRHLYLLGRMAGKTQVIARLHEQLRILRVVRIVAGSAHSSLERSVKLSAPGLQRLGVMALKTEGVSALDGAERLLRFRVIVTHRAVRRGNGIMQACFQQIRHG